MNELTERQRESLHFVHAHHGFRVTKREARALERHGYVTVSETTTGWTVSMTEAGRDYLRTNPEALARWGAAQ
jgi:hypothetical protein